MKLGMRILLGVVSAHLAIVNGVLFLARDWSFSLITNKPSLIWWVLGPILASLVAGSYLYFTKGKEILGARRCLTVILIGTAVPTLYFVYAVFGRATFPWGLFVREIIFIGLPFAYGIGGIVIALQKSPPPSSVS